MAERIADIAADPFQYDRKELYWETEGSKESPNRRLFLASLQPTLATVKGKKVVEIGCGQGWLGDEVKRHGGSVVGVEPSVINAQRARNTYPSLPLVRSSLQEFATVNGGFDMALMVMVENFRDLNGMFEKVANLLNTDGQLVSIVSDYERSIQPEGDYLPEIQMVGLNEAAIRIDSGKRFGVLCDIVRPIDRYEKAAREAGFSLQTPVPILPTEDHP